MTTEPALRATYGDVFAVSEFRAMLLSRTLTITGVTLRMLAVSVLVLAATGSPLMAGLAFGIGFLPQIVGGLTLLSLADRVRPRRALVLGCLLEAAAAGAIAVVPIPPWAVLLASVAVVTPIFSAAAAALVPSLLTGDRYVLGRSLLVMTSAGSQVAGLGLGGLALALLSPRRTLVVVVVLHLVAAATTRLVLGDHPATAVQRTGGTVRATWVGNRALVADRAVRGQLLAQTLPPALVTGAEGLVVAYSVQVHLPAGTAGLLLAAVPVGMAIGNVCIGRFAAPPARERLTRPLLLVLGAPLMLFAFRPPLVAALALLLLTGSGSAYELGIQRRFLDVLPEGVRAQAFGLVSTVLMFGQGICPVVFGALGSVFSPAVAIALSGASVTLVPLALARHLRPAPAPENLGATTVARPEPPASEPEAARLPHRPDPVAARRHGGRGPGRSPGRAGRRRGR
jgi:MFS family permease